MRNHGDVEFTITQQTADRVRAEMPAATGILSPFGVAHAVALGSYAGVRATLLVAGRSELAPGAKGLPFGTDPSASLGGSQSDALRRAELTTRAGGSSSGLPNLPYEWRSSKGLSMQSQRRVDGSAKGHRRTRTRVEIIAGSRAERFGPVVPIPSTTPFELRRCEVHR